MITPGWCGFIQTATGVFGELFQVFIHRMAGEIEPKRLALPFQTHFFWPFWHLRVFLLDFFWRIREHTEHIRLSKRFRLVMLACCTHRIIH
ncbi:Uncharacterised protein [Vibrio cholerae]|uniref:Uncharacterized protein n=1 Tax=Vibrio cholerae TaxID=666 RepID=A0A655XER0_VIBCL|nr:Uncharacterised protein [Vibrio cholerae]CSD15742.1 Uncharacterised protein [Vibrio cholerae]CSI81041.1 Uncharacterised protein [Vibrio cholerae]CSI95648.1 Uncharacterised protein [Vibrio cholerae]